MTSSARLPLGLLAAVVVVEGTVQWTFTMERPWRAPCVHRIVGRIHGAAETA
jgi:hypothetical protein